MPPVERFKGPAVHLVNTQLLGYNEKLVIEYRCREEKKKRKKRAENYLGNVCYYDIQYTM
jgi:hypothetical protein